RPKSWIAISAPTSSNGRKFCRRRAYTLTEASVPKISSLGAHAAFANDPPPLVELLLEISREFFRRTHDDVQAGFLEPLHEIRCAHAFPDGFIEQRDDRAWRAFRRQHPVPCNELIAGQRFSDRRQVRHCTGT